MQMDHLDFKSKLSKIYFKIWTLFRRTNRCPLWRNSCGWGLVVTKTTSDCELDDGIELEFSKAKNGTKGFAVALISLQGCTSNVIPCTNSNTHAVTKVLRNFLFFLLAVSQTDIPRLLEHSTCLYLSGLQCQPTSKKDTTWHFVSRLF